MIVAGAIQDNISYDAIGRGVSDVTPLGQFNASYVGETAQVNTVTALGQSISGSPGLTTYGYLPNSGDRCRQCCSLWCPEVQFYLPTLREIFLRSLVPLTKGRRF